MRNYNKSAVVKTMQCIVSTKKAKAFTLVELIIVITILAILATIAFISFQGYNKNARDGNRLATIRNVEKGLELYQLKTTFYPIPENITGTGVIGGDTVNFVGVVGEEISKVIGIGKGPKDPSSDNYYLYGLSENKRKYQIGITLEKLESSIISKTAYADTYYAKVLGNYTYPLKLGPKLYSMPSLLFVGPSITDLATFTGFVVDKGANLPYSLNGNATNTKDITELLQDITGTSATLSLTGVDISSYSSNLALKGADTIAIETALGIKKDLVGQAIFGKNYYSNDLVTNTTSSGTTTPPPVTTCTSWTYSTGSCQPNSTASLTVLTSLPSGCTGGTPLTTTSCTYTPPATTYTITTCPTINNTKNGTSPTKATILANINAYIGCNITGGQIAGYTYSGSIIEANKMVLVVEITKTAGAGTTQWGSNGTDISTLGNITGDPISNNMHNDILSWDGLANTQKIVTAIGGGESGRAAQLCNAKGTGRYLPASEELNQLYCYSNTASTSHSFYGNVSQGANCVAKGYPTTHIGTLSNFVSNYYWSSTEGSNVSSRFQVFYSGNHDYGVAKGNPFAVACVSRF